MLLQGAIDEMFTTERSVGSQVSSAFSFFPFGGNGKQTVASERTALTLPAFYNGVDQLSNDIAKLPKFVFKKNGESREKFTSHPVNYLIAARPNEMMNSFDFWKVVEYTKIVKGNAYCEIVRNAYSGAAESIIYLTSADVNVYQYENKLYYTYKGRTILSENILHFKGFTIDGIIGIGIITFAAFQLGVILDAQNFQQEVFKDRGLGYGVIESEQNVTKENKKALEDGFSSKMNSKNKFNVPLLDAGMKYKSITVTPAEAQFLETNKNGVLEVCRWLNIAPHKLKELGNSNYSNVYQQSIEHVQDAVLPRVVSNEQELNNKLFSKEEQDIIYVKFNIAVLLRGDLEMKQKFYTAMVYAGIYTRNEVRALEDMNPIDGLDEPLLPVNMQALSVAMELLTEQNKGNGTGTK